MALKVGSLYVSLSAQTGAFIKGLGEAVKAVEKTAKTVKRASREIASFGTVIAGSIAAALVVAAKHDPKVDSAMTNLRDNFEGIADSVAHMAMPALQDFTNVVNRVLGFIQNLSPETKSLIGKFMEWGVAITIGAFALSKLMSGLIGTLRFAQLLGGAFTKVFGNLLVFLGPALPILAGLALAFGALWVASAFLRAAFTGLGETVGGVFSFIGDIASSLWNGILDVARPVFKWFHSVAVQLVDWFLVAFNSIKQIYIGWAMDFLGGIDKVMAYFGKDSSGITNLMRDLVKYADNLTTVNGIKDFFEDALTTGKGAFAQLKGDVAGFAEFVKKHMPSLGDGPKGKVPHYRKYEIKELSPESKLIGTSFVQTLSMGGESPVARAVANILQAAQKELKKFDKELSFLPPRVQDILSHRLGRDFGAEMEEALKHGDHVLAEGIKTQFSIAVEFAKNLDTNGGAIADNFSKIFNGVNFGDQIAAALKAGDNETAKHLADKFASMTSGMEQLFSSAIGKLGKMGGVINSAMQGFQSGGPWGAIIAIILDLISEASSFQLVLKTFDDGIKMLGDMFNGLLDPLVEVNIAANDILKAVMGLLTPALKQIGDLFRGFAPVLEIISNILGPTLSVLSTVIGALLSPLDLITNVSFRVLFEAVKWFGVGVLYVAKALQIAINWLVHNVANLIRGIADWTIAGAKPFAGLAAWADKLDGVTSSVDDTQAKIDALKNATFDGTQAQLDQTKAVMGATSAVNSFADSLTNVPSGFKVELARFNAANPVGGSGGGFGSGGLGHSQQGLSADGGDNSTIVINVGGSIIGVEDLAMLLRDAAQRKSVRQMGGRGRLDAAAAAGF